MKRVPNTFPSVDPGTTRLALIGESPGSDECIKGRPFVGASGWHLDQWLNVAGIRREACFVGNVVQERPSPSSNDFNLFEWHEPRVQAGIAQLVADLHTFRPNVIVPLGNAALHLMRHGNTAPPKNRKGEFAWPSPISTWRGSLLLAHESFALWTPTEGVPVALEWNAIPPVSSLAFATI